MKIAYIHKPFIYKPMHNQAGVVLFIALVALLVMSLGAVALIRSVDTNSQITGNVSYKQTAQESSSYGIENMADTLGIKLTAYQEVDDAGNGYHATCKTFDQGVTNPCNGSDLTDEDNWSPGTTSRLASGLAIANGLDAYGNKIQYIVERMCKSAGPATKANCLMVSSNANNNSKNVIDMPRADIPESLVEVPVYRVTVQVTGPKNTISYIQAFIS